MFNNNRYLTCGVDSTIPLELQLFLRKQSHVPAPLRGSWAVCLYTERLFGFMAVCSGFLLLRICQTDTLCRNSRVHAEDTL